MGDSAACGAADVEIMQEGGCSGGCTFGCTAPRFNDVQMDQKLAPYISQQLYEDVLGKANELLKRKGPTWKVALFCLPFIVGALVLFRMAKPARNICEAANGGCTGMHLDPMADQCCMYSCCDQTGCDFWEASENTECKCVGKGKSRVCHGRMQVEGQFRLEEAVLWPYFVAMPLVLLYIAGPIWVLYANCALRTPVEAVLQPWTEKGLTCTYIAGIRYNQARIRIALPSGAALLGAPMGA